MLKYHGNPCIICILNADLGHLFNYWQKILEKVEGYSLSN